MAGMYVSSTSIVKPAAELQDAALKQAISNPLKHSEIIAHLTQLKNDCSVSVIDKNNGRYAIASYYMDLPFFSIALMLETIDDVLELFTDLVNRHPEIKSQPVYGLYDQATANIIENNFAVTHKVQELKMTVDPKVICDVSYDSDRYRMERLTTDDLIAISRLYQIVPAMDWTPKALQFGPYFGIYDEENLVTIAGVQYLTDQVAEIGNIVTHYEHRRKNLAYAATKAVVDSMIGKTQNQFLCVMADNEPAIKLYEKMGFVRYENLYLMQYYF